MSLEFSELKNKIRKELGVENEWTDPMKKFNLFDTQEEFEFSLRNISEPIDFNKYKDRPYRLAGIILGWAEICGFKYSQLGPDLEAFKTNFPETYEILKGDVEGCLQMCWMFGGDCWTRHYKRYPDLEDTILSKGDEENILSYTFATVGFRLPKEIEEKYPRLLSIEKYTNLPVECPSKEEQDPFHLKDRKL